MLREGAKKKPTTGSGQKATPPIGRNQFFARQVKPVPAGQAKITRPQADASSAERLKQLVDSAIKPSNAEAGLGAVRQIASFSVDAHERVLALGRVAKNSQTQEAVSELAISNLYLMWETGDGATKREVKRMLEHLWFDVDNQKVNSEAEKTLKNIEEKEGKGKPPAKAPAVPETTKEKPAAPPASEMKGQKTTAATGAGSQPDICSVDDDFLPWGISPRPELANTKMPLDPALAARLDDALKRSRASLEKPGSSDPYLFRTGDESDSPGPVKPKAGAQGKGKVPAEAKKTSVPAGAEPKQAISATPVQVPSPQTKTGWAEARQKLREAALKFEKLPVPLQPASIKALFMLLEDKSVKTSPAGKEFKGITVNSAPNEIMIAIAKALKALGDRETLFELAKSERFIVRTFSEKALRDLALGK